MATKQRKVSDEADAVMTLAPSTVIMGMLLRWKSNRSFYEQELLRFFFRFAQDRPAVKVRLGVWQTCNGRFSSRNISDALDHLSFIHCIDEEWAGHGGERLLINKAQDLPAYADTLRQLGVLPKYQPVFAALASKFDVSIETRSAS